MELPNFGLELAWRPRRRRRKTGGAHCTITSKCVRPEGRTHELARGAAAAEP